MGDRLGASLLELGYLDTSQLANALHRKHTRQIPFPSAVVSLGYLTEEEITEALAQAAGLPRKSLNPDTLDPSLSQIIPHHQAHKHRLLPLGLHQSVLTIALSDPTHLPMLDRLGRETAYQLSLCLVSESDLERGLRVLYPDSLQTAGEGTREVQQQGHTVAPRTTATLESLTATAHPSIQAPDAVDSILCEGIRLGASDVHLEPHARHLLIRCRVDGCLRDRAFLPPDLHRPVLSRLKVMAGLDIGERRLPQDGRIRLRCLDAEQSRDIDLRVSTLPTLEGERLVLRLLDPLRTPLDLSDLGLNAHSVDCFERSLGQSHGLILVTGPTGSGKSSTLYSCLHRLNRREVNIVTAEDPVECRLPDITQLQVRDRIGLTFGAALRSFLRQDPDIMMIGEIRDRETAEMSIRAALTGHLVLTTLHTNDAPSSPARLIDMGVAPYLVSGAVNLICAQRLLRRLCNHCKKEAVVHPTLIEQLGMTRQRALFRAVGCPLCNSTGYSGRVGIFEVLEMTPSIRQLVQEGASSRDIRQAARRAGMLSLRESALETLGRGITSVDEVLRGTHPPQDSEASFPPN